MNVDIINKEENYEEENIEEENFEEINKIYLDEELPEIEYYEILSFDEIVLENPLFIAFTKNEIYNELNDIFDNPNKTNNFVKLFYDVVDKEKINTSNYVLITDSIKKTYNENDDKIEPDRGLFEFIDTFKKINKFKDLDLAKKEKNKLFFTIIYDEKSKLVRFKPFNKTKVKIDNEENNYILLKDDDTYIPVKNIYYSIPKYNINDYLSDKVLSYLNKNIDLKIINTEIISNNNINNELIKAKPTLENILEILDIDELKNTEELDYNIWNIILNKFDYNLDKINIENESILNKFISKIFINIKSEKNIYKSIRKKIVNIVNNKILFYEKNINIFKLLKLTDNIKEENYKIIDKLEDEKNLMDNPEILYNNIYDITKVIYNNEIDEKIIIENIRNIINYQRIDNIINTLKNINTNDIENIEELYNIEKKKYESMLNYKNFLYEKSLKFINFSNEINEIKEGNDDSKYYIADINYINDIFIDQDNKDDLDYEENIDLNYLNYNLNKFDEYTESLLFKHAIGFKEYIKIILPIIYKIQEKSKLEIDYNILCNNLYKKFSNLPSKFYILKNKILEIDDTISDKIINDICNINSKILIKDYNLIKNIKMQMKLQINNYIDKNIDKILDILIDYNKLYINNIKNIINYALAIWILEIQESIIEGTHLHNYNYNYIHLWSENGYPIMKNKKVGVTIYLCDITSSIFEECEEYEIYDIDNRIIDNITKIIEEEYSDKLLKLQNNSKVSNNIINKNKGKKYQYDLVDNLNEIKKTKNLSIKDKMLINYVNALIYMPGINYNRIHKYLLGCCLQKLNKNFTADSDMIGKRNDLITAKKYFSKNRENNKPREYAFISYNNNIEDNEDNDDDKDDEDDENNKYIKLLHNNVNYSIEKYDYDIWFNKFENDNKLFTENNYINIFKNGSSEYIKIIKNYLELLTSTINNNKSTISKLFIDNIDKINFKLLINNSIHVLSLHLNNNSDNVNIENYNEILENSIKYIKYLLLEYNNLNKIYTTDNISDILRAKAYICIKAICCPFNPEHVIGNKMQLYMETNNYNTFVIILKEIHQKIINILNYSKMPTFKENQDFLNKMREEFKNKKLDIFNKQNEEQRKILNELTKIGIRVENLDENMLENEIIINDDIPLFNGEDEFRINTNNNDDNDPDNLDNEEHGFIYS